jgi:ribose transport system permease protein
MLLFQFLNGLDCLFGVLIEKLLSFALNILHQSVCSGLPIFSLPRDPSRVNLENLLFTSTIIAVVAIGEAFVLMVAGIDLSVGAVLALSSVMCVGL